MLSNTQSISFHASSIGCKSSIHECYNFVRYEFDCTDTALKYSRYTSNLVIRYCVRNDCELFIVHGLLLRLRIMRHIWEWQYVEFDISSLKEMHYRLSLTIKLVLALLKKIITGLTVNRYIFLIFSSQHQNVKVW